MAEKQRVELSTAEEWDSTFKHAKPCGKCPFLRTCSPTPEGSGFSHPMRHIGQAHGPFGLPCHQDGGFEDTPDPITGRSKAKVGVGIAQCAGAAIYRANVGVDKRLPDSFMKLPPNTELVFASPVEMLAHFLQISPLESQIQLMIYPVEQALHDELVLAQKTGKLMMIKNKENKSDA